MALAFHVRSCTSTVQWRVQELQKIDCTCPADVWAQVTICITRGNRRWAFFSYPRTARRIQNWPGRAKKGQNR